MSGNEISSYCREIEAYLCQKNDGHLIRVVGPSFELVSRWAADGVPLKIAFRGIDRYFERYYRKGPRRRPVRIDFCEADVLDVFDEWKRATGIVTTSHSQSIGNDDPRTSTGPSPAIAEQRGRTKRGPSLPEHLERVLLKLTSARAGGKIGAGFDELLDRISRELDAARADARGLRGEARRALIERLDVLDSEMVALARGALDQTIVAAMTRDAEDELSGFRTTMTDEAFARAREAAIIRLVRERLGLPTVALTS